MPRQLVNTFNPVTSMGAATSNLINAFAPESGGRLRDLKAQKIQRELGAPSKLGEVFRRVYSPQTPQIENPHVTEADIAAAFPEAGMPVGQRLTNEIPNLVSAAAQGGSYGQIGQLIRTMVANAPGAETGAIDKAMLGAGNSYGSTMGGTREGEAAAMARKVYGVQNTPVNVGAGGTLFTPQGEELAQGKSTYSTVRGAILEGLPLDQQLGMMNRNGITVSPDGTVQIGGPASGLTKSVKTGLQNQGFALEDFQGLMGNMRGIAEQDPTIFGMAGMAKGAIQDVQGQLGTLHAAFGGQEGFDSAVTQARQGMLSAGLDEAGMFDPNLPAIVQLANLAAYSAASALAQQEGRGLSDKDLAAFKKVIGDPRSPLMTQQKFLANMDQLEQLTQSRLGSNQGRQGFAPAPGEAITPGITIDEGGNIIQ